MKGIKFLLLYPPEQQWPGCIVKPNGSLAYPYLGGALRDIGVEAKQAVLILTQALEDKFSAIRDSAEVALRQISSGDKK